MRTTKQKEHIWVKRPSQKREELPRKLTSFLKSGTGIPHWDPQIFVIAVWIKPVPPFHYNKNNKIWRQQNKRTQILEKRPSQKREELPRKLTSFLKSGTGIPHWDPQIFVIAVWIKPVPPFHYNKNNKIWRQQNKRTQILEKRPSQKREELPRKLTSFLKSSIGIPHWDPQIFVIAVWIKPMHLFIKHSTIKRKTFKKHSKKNTKKKYKKNTKKIQKEKITRDS